MNRPVLLLTLAGSLLATSAEAQFSRRDPATGEKYNVEVAYGWWNPNPDIQISSESLGIPGTLIDFETDLGIEKKRLPEFRAVLRPARKHKFRLAYMPIQYDVEGHILTRPIVFNGQVFNVGLPVNVDASWKTWRIGYEYDFVYRDRGFFGVLLEAKYTKASIDFTSPVNSEFTEVSAPIPSIGFTGRGYVARNVALGGEFAFFRLPNGEDDERQGSYYDFDLYGILNFNNNVGVTGGWRKLDLSYTVDFDEGALKMTGYYVMGVVRF